MASPNSSGSGGAGKPNPGVIDLGTIIVDSDIIFGFTSHLLKRKTKPWTKLPLRLVNFRTLQFPSPGQASSSPYTATDDFYLAVGAEVSPMAAYRGFLRLFRTL
ncbi:hypothetical protein WMY93_017335 [Mugilogobius chulae]|uniref:Uncharacterized protein n=1 Tax=Mugilogobius chulae TaxID=88201 RepID=A0AAW0NQM4_9GOBI